MNVVYYDMYVVVYDFVSYVRRGRRTILHPTAAVHPLYVLAVLRARTGRGSRTVGLYT